MPRLCAPTHAQAVIPTRYAEAARCWDRPLRCPLAAATSTLQRFGLKALAMSPCPIGKSDGGQSLEPHSSVATDIEQSEGSSSVSSVAATSGDAASKSATATPTTPGKAEVIFLDDITIDMTAP